MAKQKIVDDYHENSDDKAARLANLEKAEEE